MPESGNDRQERPEKLLNDVALEHQVLTAAK